MPLLQEGFSNTFDIISKEEFSENNGRLYSFRQIEELSGATHDFLSSLAKIFITATVANSAEMVSAAQTENWPVVSKLAHKMKSTIDNLDIVSIKKEIRVLETDAKYEINTTALLRTAIEVDTIINQVAERIKEEFDL